MFQFISRSGNLTEMMPRLYVSCHPDDFADYFDSVCNAVFNSQDCAVFYTDNMNADLGGENALKDLESMNLYVIPVTYKLIKKSCPAVDYILKFALEKHIPVIAIAMEPCLFELFFESGKFRYCQYISAYNLVCELVDYSSELDDCLGVIYKTIW